jgi:hypothetical protein
VVDCLSGSNGKEGIAKAANLLCSAYFNGDTHGDDKRKPTFTEADMASALKAVGMLGKVTLSCMLCFIQLFSYLSCFTDFIT